MIYKESLPDGESVRVTFELPSSLWAERVNLVGDFNDWDTNRHEMSQSRSNGNWRITLVLPTGKEYQFRYLVNGQRLAQRMARRQVHGEQVRLR